MIGMGSGAPRCAKVAAFLFVGVVFASGWSFPSQGVGFWPGSNVFWFSRVAILSLAGVAVWQFRECQYRKRETSLELAILKRTEDLAHERQRQRNRILEMIVSNQPLGSVLDAIVGLIRSQCPGALCAIVTKRGEGCQVAAAPDLPREWLLALRASYSVPADLWRRQLRTARPHEDPEWNSFVNALGDRAPAAIRSWPLRNEEEALGAVLLFYRDDAEPEEVDMEFVRLGCHLTRLALEHSRLYDDLHFQAEQDLLTGLGNRCLYEERLGRSLREAQARGQKLAAIFVDLDHFKQINHSCTHKVADRILAEVARRMAHQLRAGDMIARVGGDEFSIVVNDLESSAEAAEVAGRILASIREPISIDAQQVELTASAGVAMFPEDAATAEQLERTAEAAMYQAKELGRNRVQTFATRSEALDRARIEEEMRLALQNGWFVVHYQPKVRADRKVVGFEALVRMNHPKHGLVPPGDFIPIAEEDGLIIPLGLWVLEDVCRQVAAWEVLGLGQVPVAVNVSPLQICRPDFAKAVESCLHRYRVHPANLELELTEGMLISAAGVAQDQLRALRELGVKLSIDDFGTGYASLSYLHRLQFDSIKLDRSFVQSIDTDDLARRLVNAMIGVARGLGLSVVAEGVETESQCEALLRAGCPLMQGFLFSKPKPASELENLLVFPARAPAADGTNLVDVPTGPNECASPDVAGELVPA